MPLTISDTLGTHVEQTCAQCARKTQLEVASLQLGIPQNADTIRLPTCDCGAVEFLLRTWDQAPASDRGAPHDLHRRFVNELAVRLKADGRSHPAVKAVHDGETAAPKDRPLPKKPAGQK